jgi:hypothetical protein
MKESTVVNHMDLGHTRIEQWTGDKSHNQFVRLDARRVENTYSGKPVDEAQIEILITQTPVHGKRTTTIVSGVVLTPEHARKLALALCPELDPEAK